MKTLIILLLLSTMCCFHCAPVAGNQPVLDTTGKGEQYFANPASAVDRIKVMLKEKDWVALAKYYDLSDSPVEREDLVSGKFFYTDEKPEAAHSAGFWKYKHPFDPAFDFQSVRELDETGIVEVIMVIKIDQGGGLTQQGQQVFYMRRSESGYRIIPEYKNRVPEEFPVFNP